MNLQDLMDLSFATTSNPHASFKDYKNKRLIIYFYPKDATPGCTIESQNFRDAYPTLQGLGVEILGVSRDTLKSHHRFKEKQQLPFELIADESEQLCNAFDVIREKNMYGKTVRGIERSTFLFDLNGNLEKEWRKVNAKNHVAEVLAVLQSK